MSIDFKNLIEEDYKFQLKTLNWRNSTDVSQYFQISEISKEIHENWLKSLKDEPKKQIAFVIYYEENPIGLTYFRNITEADCDWGMYIYDTNIRGQGLGQKTLAWAINYAKETLKLSKIKLEVKKDNPAAVNCYKKLGFLFVEDKKKEFQKYEKQI